MSVLVGIPKDSFTSFTCITCRVAFKDADVQRLHYKSDWHRYNLKRKVAELPPVTAEEFQRRVNKQRTVDESLKQDKNVYCLACHKSFGNQNAFDNHLNSKKHKDNEKSSKSDCGIEIRTPKSSVGKMESDSDIEVDSDEWEEDSENPIDNNDCIFCMHHSRNFFKNLEHMTISHSFFIPDIEYCTDLTGMLRYLADKVSKVQIPELDGSDYQLVLPSGVTVGHRSLMRYYKQSINPNKAVVVVHNNKKLHKVLATYRSLGWTETQQVAAARKARDIHFMKRMQSRYNMKMGMKNNNLLQKHFRRQVQF